MFLCWGGAFCFQSCVLGIWRDILRQNAMQLMHYEFHYVYWIRKSVEAIDQSTDQY